MTCDPVATPGCTPGSTSVVPNAGVNSRWRHLVDGLLDVHPTASFHVMLNGDYGTEDLGGARAEWYGGALMAEYSFSDNFALAARGEYVIDADGFLAAYTKKVGFGSGTVTLSYRPTAYALLRFENRLDAASEPVFAKGISNNPTDRQLTSSLSVVITTAKLFGN